MNEENTNVLIKSEKTSQEKNKRIVWAVSALLLIIALAVALIPLAVDYSNYKEGQEVGLAFIITVSNAAGADWVDEYDSYESQCASVYFKLAGYTPDRTINGVHIDASGVRDAQQAVRDGLYDFMESEGYDRFGAYSIYRWFEYTDIVEYFFGYYFNFVSFCCGIIILFSIVFSITFTVLVNQEAKKELIVYEDSVLCRSNPQKSKQLVFEDINNVDLGKNAVKIVGTNLQFKISNLTNAEEIQSVIIEKKKSAQSKSESLNISGADELKKYKDLLDDGVISQEEFDAKKKQILGL